MNETTQLVLTIDMKKHRIRIYKTTLHALGDPKFVELLVNPVNKVMAVRGLDKETTDSHRINIFDLHHSCEFYSKQLTNALSGILGDIDLNGTYRFYGEHLQKENLVLFPINTIQKTSQE